MTVEELIRHLHNHFGLEEVVCSHLWCKYDILQRVDDRIEDGEDIPKMTEAEACEILGEMERKLDYTIGVTWDTIDTYIDDWAANKSKKEQS